MAKINSNKFIPQNKTENEGLSSQRVSIASGIGNISSSSLNPSDVKPEGNKNQPKTLLFEVIEIRKNTLSILKIIKGNSSLLKKSEERKRKENERKKFEEKELRSEEKKNKLIPDFKPTEFPKMGFLDRIKQFLFYTLLGAAFTKFGKHIPKVLNFLKLLGPAFKNFETITGNILNGVVDFVGFGYKAYDQVKNIIAGISGDDTEKRLKEFDTQFNKFANLALIAGMAASGSADFSVGGGRKKERLGVDRQTGQKVSKRTQARYLSQHGEKAYIKKFGKRSYKGLTGKTAGRFGGRLAGKALGKVPIIGGLIDFIISTVIFKEKPGRAAAKAVGATIGSALGTFVPVPFAGTILGGILGDIVGGALYDSLVGGDKLKGKAQGGQVTRGKKSASSPISRTIKKTRTKPPRIQPQRTIPGKDIGGREEIKKLFPSPTDPRQKNPLGVLETASKNYKEKVPLIGSIMGASLDSTMGQRPDPRTFKKIGTGFGHLIQNAIDAETSGTIASVQNQIVGLANGGVVPRTLSTNENIGVKIGESIGKTLETMVNSQVNRTLQSIRQQFTKKDYSAPDGGSFDGRTPDGYDGGGQVSPELLQAGIPENMAGYLTRLAYLETRIRNIPNAEGSPGMGYYQAFPAFTQEAIQASGGLSPRDADFTTASKATMAWIKKYNPKAFDAIISGDFRKADNLLKNTWPSLPGGSQAQPAEVQRQSNRYLPSKTKGPEAMVTGGILPSQIPTTSGQGWRWGKMHKGIDLDGGDGSPISSAQDAKVVWSGDKGDGYGYSVILRYSNGAETRFGHLKSTNVRTGQSIKAGQMIGRQGNTGASKGSHLHFEYYPNGGAMTYEGYGNAAAVKDSYFRYGGNVKAKIASKPMDEAGNILGKDQITLQKKPTPRGKLYLVNGKKYYVDEKNNTLKDQQGNDIDFSGGKNKWLIDAIKDQRNAPGPTLKPTLGGTPQASLAPKQISKIAFGLDQQGDYEFAGGVTFISQTRIIEKQVTIPAGGSIVNNNTSFSSFNQIQSSLTIG